MSYNPTLHLTYSRAEMTYPQYLCPSPGEAGLHDIQEGEDLLAERHLEGHHGGVGGAEHDELHLGLQDDVVVGVGDCLETSDEGGEMLMSWRTGEEAAVHGDTASHGLVGGQREAAGGAGPGGVVVSGVGGEDRMATVPT